MIYRFTIVSDEADNFLREIKIDADATFLDLCKAVLASCNYSDDQITSFYITNDEWEKISEVTREDMGTSYSDEDVYVMEDTRLRDVIEEEHQRMMFIFDTFEQRALYMELKEIIPGTNLKEAAVSRSIDEAPQQLLMQEPAKQKKVQQADTDSGEDFYGSDGFNEDDLDNEGLDISENIPY